MMSIWQNFSSREKIMVTIGALFGLFYVFYKFGISPIGAWHQSALDENERTRTGYEQVILAARRHGEPEGGAREAGNVNANVDLTTSLKSALPSRATNAGLVATTFDGDDNQVQITLAPADPARLYAYMADIEQSFGAVITQARISRARANPELVRADRLVFTRQSPQ